MIDLHTHTIFSDGELIPAELARRAQARGIRAIALTDHGDFSNLDFIIPRMISIAETLNSALSIKLIAGIEITHIPPTLIADAVNKARSLGAKLVVMHGETIVEPVAPGTNRAAIDAGVDILAHPGLISKEDVKLARDKNVFLEITARRGHSLSNGHVASLAKEIGAKLLINTDSHSPNDLVGIDFAKKIVLGAGLDEISFENMRKNAEWLVKRLYPFF